MRYVALLRGLNVGGKNAVSMSDIASVFLDAGHTQMKTLVNNGNVVFDARRTSTDRLADALASAISDRFELVTRVLVLPGTTVRRIAAAIPDEWLDRSHSSCNVIFLMPERAAPHTVDLLDVDPRYEDVKYVAGAIISRVDVAHIGRASVHRLAGTELYPAVTLRRGSITRKLAELATP